MYQEFGKNFFKILDIILINVCTCTKKFTKFNNILYNLKKIISKIYFQISKNLEIVEKLISLEFFYFHLEPYLIN